VSKNAEELPFDKNKGGTFEGTLERVVYQNEENGWSVVKIAVPGRYEHLTAVGNLLGLQIGENLRVTGEWKKDPRFGDQLVIKNYVAVKPNTLLGIERYLASGLVPGIGPTMAKRIVEKFGVDSLEIIENKGHRLKEVEGIGKVRASRILAAWGEQKDIKDVMVFLQSHEVSTAYAIRIYKRYGKSAVRVVRENPYQLAIDVFGIGFLTADRIAASLGIAKDSPERARAGVLHAMTELIDEGHCFAPRPLLVERAKLLLEIDEVPVAEAITVLANSGELVLEIDAVYKRVLHDAERRAAVRLASLSGPYTADIDTEKAVAWYEAENHIELAEEQRNALAHSLSAKVSVITGGPGTGKTTIVKGLLKILEKKRRKLLLAAPTGRAAKRMQEATGREAKTIHRLLEIDPKRGIFTRNQETPLEADVLIIDETSMVDLLLFDHLLAAVPPHAQLILVGDVDQLPSVGPGSVLADVISSGVVRVTKLEKIFRQAAASLIITNAHKINRGEVPQNDKAATPENADFFFIERGEPEKALETIKELIQNRIPARFKLDAIDDIQVLTPMNKGSLGVGALNTELQALLNPEGTQLTRGNRMFRTGDKVMQLRNNYDLGVFNGDIGRVYAIETEDQTLDVRFDDRQVRYEAADLDELTLAYACSIHKSQGSEFPVVVIPLSTQHFVMLQRNLLYTAVTRGKRLVVIVGSSRAMAMAVNNGQHNVRFTQLADRLRAAKSA
jgi:exodeoxyribonuclease V alpha subunit